MGCKSSKPSAAAQPTATKATEPGDEVGKTLLTSTPEPVAKDTVPADLACAQEQTGNEDAGATPAAAPAAGTLVPAPSDGPPAKDLAKEGKDADSKAPESDTPEPECAPSEGIPISDTPKDGTDTAADADAKAQPGVTVADAAQELAEDAPAADAPAANLPEEGEASVDKAALSVDPRVVSKSGNGLNPGQAKETSQDAPAEADIMDAKDASTCCFLPSVFRQCIEPEVKGTDDIKASRA